MSYSTASSRQIRAGAIKNEHISSSLILDESQVAIDWASRGQEILSSKLVVDFVQVSGYSLLAGESRVVLTEGTISGPHANADDIKGPIVQDGKNRVVVRASDTKDVLISDDGTEVYAKLGYDEDVSAYTLSFFCENELGEEIMYSVPGDTVIDFQFPRRFDLFSVSESFASNEKFVDGACDVSTKLDFQQIIQDVFGVSYALNQDGEKTMGVSIVDRLTDMELTHETYAADQLAVDTAQNDTIEALQTEFDEVKTLVFESIYTPDPKFVLDYEVKENDPLIDQSEFTFTNSAFVAGDRSLMVFVNGMLQMEGLHYTEVVDNAGSGTAVSFAPEKIAAGDVLQFRGIAVVV